MKNKDRKPRLVGLRRSMHGTIWMIGIAILAWQGWWWPGNLVLVGIRMAAEGILMQFAPQAFDRMEQSRSSSTPLSSPPATCPGCGGPLRGHKVKWTGSRSANCPCFGANIMMKQSG